MWHVCRAPRGAGWPWWRWRRDGSRLLVPQHVRGGRRVRGSVALQVVRQGGVQPLASLPLAHSATLPVPLLPGHLQPHRHPALTSAPQACRAAAQALSSLNTDERRHRPLPCTGADHIARSMIHHHFSLSYRFPLLNINVRLRSCETNHPVLIHYLLSTPYIRACVCNF